MSVRLKQLLVLAVGIALLSISASTLPALADTADHPTRYVVMTLDDELSDV
jgi:hypothetical protein